MQVQRLDDRGAPLELHHHLDRQLGLGRQLLLQRQRLVAGMHREAHADGCDQSRPDYRPFAGLRLLDTPRAGGPPAGAQLQSGNFQRTAGVCEQFANLQPVAWLSQQLIAHCLTAFGEPQL